MAADARAAGGGRGASDDAREAGGGRARPLTLARLCSAEIDERLEALEGLARGTPGAEYAVRDVLLGDEHADVRAAAAACLGRLGAKATATALVDALYDGHPSVRLASCRSLAKLGERGGGPALRRLATEEPVWWVRRAAVLAVARLERGAAVALLRQVLDDPFWRVRHAAVRALVALGERSPEVVTAVAADGEGSERARGALRYLARRFERRGAGGRGGGADPLAIEGPVADVPGAEGLAVEPPPRQGPLADPDPAVTAARLERGRAATPAELALYLGDPHEPLRAAASRALRAAGSARALLAAAWWLEEPRIPYAAGAVVSLLDSLDDEAAEALFDAVLARPDERPGAALWALSAIAAQQRWGRLDDVLRAAAAASPLARRGAAAALGALLARRRAAPGPALARLAAALADGDEDVRRLAAHGLVNARDPAARAAALALRFDEQPPLVRRLLAAAADGAGDVGVLRRAAGDADAAVRARGLAALHGRGLLGDAEIARARASADPWVRAAVLDARAALEALRSDVDPRLKRAAFARARSGGLGLEAARIAMADDDPWLRARAAERLARSRDDGDLVAVLALSRDPDLAVRAAAADVLAVSARDLPERLARVRPLEGARDAADAWLGARATEPLRAGARGEAGAVPTSGPTPRAPTSAAPGRALGREVASPRALGREVASPRALGRTGLIVSPLVISGANEPSVAALFRAEGEGCNAFFWEPRYRNLTTFLRGAAERGRRPLVVGGTYHATEGAIRADVERALRRLGRDRLDVFLVFWARSPARLEGEAGRALARLRDEGLVRAAGFSTHDRALAEGAIGRAPWDVVMVRHSAAHPGAEERLFGRADEAGVGVLGFSATCYGRLTRRAPGSAEPAPTAADCYRYTLSQPGVTACVSAPRGGRELVENLAALHSPALDAARLASLRAHGRAVREASLDFARHIRRYPARPDGPDPAPAGAASGRGLDADPDLEVDVAIDLDDAAPDSPFDAEFPLASDDGLF